MVAQAIFPFGTGGALSRESAPQGKSDAFQTLLRDYEARDHGQRGETARSDASRDRAEQDAELSARAWRDFDAAQEARDTDRNRDIDRNRDTSDEPPMDGDIQTDGRNLTQHDRTDESRSRAEHPGQNGQAAPANATSSQADTQGSGNLAKEGAAPAVPGLDEKGAPKPAAPAVAADPALTGNPALGATASKQSTPAVTAPAPEVSVAQDAANPKITLNPAPHTAVPGETANANVAAPAAAKGIPSTLPAAAEAVAPITEAQVKRTQVSGVPASTSEAQAAVGSPAKGAPTPATVKSQADSAGNQSPASTTTTTAPVKAPEPQAEAKQTAPANPAPANPSVQNPGQRTAKTGDTAADLIKAAAKAATPAGTAAQAQAPAAPAGFDQMQAVARTAGAPSATATATATDRPVPPSEVAVNIQRAVARGENRIRIQLHPAELGQVDVRLKIGADGIVRAMVQVDRPETLDLMQRDARGLERALQDAGLKTDSGSLSFNLRDRGDDGPQDRRNGEDTAMAGREESDAHSSSDTEAAAIAARTGGSNRVLDIRV